MGRMVRNDELRANETNGTLRQQDRMDASTSQGRDAITRPDADAQEQRAQGEGDGDSKVQRTQGNGNGNGNGIGGQRTQGNGNGGQGTQGSEGGQQSQGGRMGERDRGDEMRGGSEREGSDRGWEQPRYQGAATGGRRRWRQSPQTARDVMTRSPKTVKPGDLVTQIAQLMVDEDAGIVPVVDGGKLVGVVTDRDIVCRMVAAGTDLKSARASDVMTAEVECVTERDSLEEVLRLMGEHQVRRVPVVAKDDRLVGIISMADLAREADVDEQLQGVFEEISSERGFWSHLR